MIFANVWLLAPGHPVILEARNTPVAPCSSLPAANVSLKTAELLVFLSTALVALTHSQLRTVALHWFDGLTYSR